MLQQCRDSKFQRFEIAAIRNCSDSKIRSHHGIHGGWVLVISARGFGHRVVSSRYRLEHGDLRWETQASRQDVHPPHIFSAAFDRVSFFVADLLTVFLVSHVVLAWGIIFRRFLSIVDFAPHAVVLVVFLFFQTSCYPLSGRKMFMIRDFGCMRCSQSLFFHWDSELFFSGCRVSFRHESQQIRNAVCAR